MDELLRRLKALRDEAALVSARLQDGSATNEDVTRATELAAEIRQTQEEITALQTADDDAIDTDAANRARQALADIPDDPAPPARQDRRDRRTPTSPEQRVRPALVTARVATDFAESRSFREFRERGLSGQAFVDVAGVTGSQMALRATLADADLPTRNPYVPGMIEQQMRPLTILDQIDRQTTQLNSVDYVQESVGNEAGATEVAHGTLKPEVDVDLTEATAPVRTIAAWLNIHRQTADDHATMVGFIQGRLGFKVEFRLNNQVLNGNGTAPNLLGINNVAGINTYAPGTAEKRLISIRKAITQVQIDEYVPDTVVLNPADWETVELDTDNNGAFRVAPNVQSLSAGRIWGLAVVATSSIAAATATVGSFRQGATLWEREGVRILMTDSHASNFTSNILTILAEMRAALTVWRPSAFCKITFNGTA